MRAIAVVLTLIGGAALAAASTTEPGQPMTGGELAQLCQAPDTTSKSVCRMYILGVTQGMELGMAIADGQTQGGRPCIPDNISGGALELAVKMKLGEDLMVFPADRDLDASGLIGGVLQSTFSCSKSKR
jgi:hypothetical protein